MNTRSSIKRKWRFSRTSSTYWQELSVALLTAAVVHLLFFAVFKYRESEASELSKGSKITLYNVTAMEKNQRSRTVKWLQMHDPKLAVRGDSPFGFAGLMPKEKRRTITVSEFKPELDIPEAAELKYVPSAVRAAELKDFPQVSLLKTPGKGETVVLDPRGKRAGFDLSRIKAAVPGTGVYRLSGEGLLRRVEVVKTTAPEQDRLFSQLLLDTDISSSGEFTVIWAGGAQ